MIGTFKVGDPDPTPESGESCSAESPTTRYGCTWPPLHSPDLPHVAGAYYAGGPKIIAVWFDGGESEEK